MKSDRTEVPAIGTWSPIAEHRGLLALGTLAPHVADLQEQRATPSLAIASMDLSNKTSGSLSMFYFSLVIFIIRNPVGDLHRYLLSIYRLVVVFSPTL